MPFYEIGAKKVYSFLDLILHELGHQLGFDHYYKCMPDESSSGIMNEIQDDNEESEGLSKDDKCMFKKLYCPDLVPVEEEFVQKGNTIENFPNPFENSTYFSFSAPQIGSNVIIVVYNQLGGVVAKPINKYYSGGVHNELFNASGLPSGFYYYTIQIGKEIKSEKMIISR